MTALAAGTGFDLLDTFDPRRPVRRACGLRGSAGLKLERPISFCEWATVTRLLALAMPLTMAAVALLGAGLLGLSAGAALLLGAALAPTDPVLAIGTLAAWSVKALRSRDMLAATFDGFHAIATALVIYGLSELAGGYGLLAVFAGGLAFRRYERDHEINVTVHEGAERLEKLLELAVILLLGSMLTLSGLSAPGWEGWLLAGLLLVVVRPLACVLSLAGSRMDRPGEKAFVAWFGVRGVGTMFYAATVVASGALSAGEQKLVVWTCIAAVLVSIAVHGVTAGPSLSRLFARRRGELRRRPAPAQASARPR